MSVPVAADTAGGWYGRVAGPPSRRLVVWADGRDVLDVQRLQNRL